MNGLKKIGGINLLILLAYSLIVPVFARGNNWQMGFMIMMVVLIAIHAGMNLIISLIFFVQKDNSRGRNFLLSALLVLVIGFSTCYGIASL